MDVLLEIALMENRKSMSWKVMGIALRISLGMLSGPNVFPLTTLNMIFSVTYYSELHIPIYMYY